MNRLNDVTRIWGESGVFKVRDVVNRRLWVASSDDVDMNRDIRHSVTSALVLTQAKAL